MKFVVKGHRVLVKPRPLEEKHGAIVIARPDRDEKLEKAATQIGTVAQVGPTCWYAYDHDSPDWEPWCKVGDEIYFAQYSGKKLVDEDTKDEYFLINDVDVQAIIERE